MLTKEEKTFLLNLARETITNSLKNKPETSAPDFSEILAKELGVFVTLTIDGDLRGCIGYVEGVAPLQQAVSEMALSAAFNDPRFPPVKTDEIADIAIEISVLSPLHTISDISEIEVGRHGIIIEQGIYKGLLLPQVAVSYNWDRDTFLRQTCYKAGLPEDAWKDPATAIQIFSAEIFAE